MKEVIYFDRITKTREKELVYGEGFLHFLYTKTGFLQKIGKGLLFFVASFSLWSRLYGKIQKSRCSRNKIVPFIQKFGVDEKEFLDSVSSFHSFNDFFIRKLKPSCRPIASSPDVAILPADARYLVFPNISKMDRFFVKGQHLSLSELLKDEALTEKYKAGSLVMARLCPVDYHRFHFPCDGKAGYPRLIPGPLFSVNPIALSRHLGILSENKRMVTEIETEHFGTLLYIEVGATCVGTIHQTYTPDRWYKKGDEKGFFSFGGSCLLILFEPGKIVFNEDLASHSAQGIEVRALLGQSLGTRLLGG